MMAADAALVGTGGAGQDLDRMGWDAGDIIEEGSAEAHDAGRHVHEECKSCFILQVTDCGLWLRLR